LQRPLFLGNANSTTILRLGRTTMSLDVRGNALGGGLGSDLLPSCFSCKGVDEVVGPCSASPDELYTIMSHTAASSNVSSPVKPGYEAANNVDTDDNNLPEAGLVGNAVERSQDSDSQADSVERPNRARAESDLPSVPEHGAHEREVVDMPIASASDSIAGNMPPEGEGVPNPASEQPDSTPADVAAAPEEDAPSAGPVDKTISECAARDFYSSAADFVSGAVSAAVVAASVSDAVSDVDDESGARAPRLSARAPAQPSPLALNYDESGDVHTDADATAAAGNTSSAGARLEGEGVPNPASEQPDSTPADVAAAPEEDAPSAGPVDKTLSV
jgi:hypothetical protein